MDGNLIGDGLVRGDKVHIYDYLIKIRIKKGSKKSLLLLLLPPKTHLASSLSYQQINLTSPLAVPFPLWLMIPLVRLRHTRCYMII